MTRILETWGGCGAPGTRCGGGLGSAVPSGQYMGAIGKAVSMGGLGNLGMAVLSPTSRAQGVMGQLGIQPRRGPMIAMRGLGSVDDYRACSAATAAAGAGGAIAAGQHQASGGGDQGWSIGIALTQAAAQIGSSLCNTIDNGAYAPGAPGTAPGWPGSTAPAQSDLITQMYAAQAREREARDAQIQQYVIYGAGALVLIGAAAFILRK